MPEEQTEINTAAPVSIAEGLWWVGKGSAEGMLECNPYLLMHGGSNILFDPGSVLDVQTVAERISKLTAISDIDAIVLSHQDPDLCSSIPELERRGFNGVICCHERTSWLVVFYGISSPFYTVNTQKYRYRLKDGSYIKFLYAPYLHFPGAVMTYLPHQKTLISGDLFGALTKQWTLYAGEDYCENMKTFHEFYMPSHEILQPVMNQLLHLDIQLICPQHGSIISTGIREHIEILRDLPCGLYLRPVHQDLLDEGGYMHLCSQVLKRYFAIFGKEAVREAFSKSAITIDYRQKMIKKSSVPDSEIWDAFFDQIVRTKGMPWLTVVSPLVETFSSTYNITLPKAFRSIVFDAQKAQDIMQAQYQELENQKISLEARLYVIEEELSLCPITKLYNQRFFDIFFQQEMEKFRQQPYPFALLLISIDRLLDINSQYGSDEGNTTMRNLGYILSQFAGSSLQTFRLEGGTFALYLPGISRDAAVDTAAELKNTAAESEIFITSITISAGLYHSDELTDAERNTAEGIMSTVMQRARLRLKAAKSSGRNTLIYEPLKEKMFSAAGTVLLVDRPGLSRDLLQQAFEQEGYFVMSADDGLRAQEYINRQPPDFLICELMLPKINGFSLRRALRKSPDTADIPFMLMSAAKDEKTVKQALSLGISWFFHKPVMLTELTGVVQLITASKQQGAEHL